jgi:hypothetical protein
MQQVCEVSRQNALVRIEGASRKTAALVLLIEVFTPEWQPALRPRMRSPREGASVLAADERELEE